MGTIQLIHTMFGERVLPLLILIAAIWFTVAWKSQGSALGIARRVFPILVDLQFTLGLIYWIYRATSSPGLYLGFPFILHPILGLVTVALAHMAVGTKGPFVRLGRWAPLAAFGLMLASVLAGIVVGRIG
jgi:hypothetical protein